MALSIRQHPRYQFTERRSAPRRMADLQALRKQNLRALIKQWDGPTNLAKKLGYSGPSYLSQLIGAHKPITENTARYIERTVDLPQGWLDQEHKPKGEANGRVDNTLVARVTLAVGGAVENAGLRLSPKRLADLVSLVYDCSFEKGNVDEELVVRMVKLLSKE